MVEDAPDHAYVGEEGDDPEPPATVPADEDIEGVHAHEEGGPVEATGTGGGGGRIDHPWFVDGERRFFRDRWRVRCMRGRGRDRGS